MFEYICMNLSATVRSLQQRITEMQPLHTGERALPTAAGLRPLLPSGALRAGAAYSVQGSTSLALALLTEVSQSGAWCGVIGLPTFGAETAAHLGIALDRLVLIPEPRQHALTLTGSLSEVLTVLVLHTQEHVRPSDTERIAAKLRDHGSSLVVLGPWPRTESALRVTGSQWTGLSAGRGLLNNREMSVESRDRRGLQHHTLHFTQGALASSPSAPISAVTQLGPSGPTLLRAEAAS